MADHTADTDWIDCRDLRRNAQTGGHRQRGESGEPGLGSITLQVARCTTLRLIEPDGTETRIPVETGVPDAALRVEEPPQEEAPAPPEPAVEAEADTPEDRSERIEMSRAEEALRLAKALEEEEARAAEEAERAAKARAAAKAKAREEEQARKEAEAAARAQAERKAQEEAEAKAKAEAEEKAKREAEAKAKRKAEEKAQREAEEKARQAAAEQARREAEERAREEAAAKAKVEAEERARRQAERKAKDEAERKAKEQAERKAREEAEARAKAEAEEKARKEAEAKAEAERKAKEEAEAKAKAEAERKAKEEAERKAREEEERKAREEAERKAKEEAERKAREEVEAKAKAEAESKAKEEEKARKKAEAEARKKARAEEKAREKAEAKALAEAVEKAEKLGETFRRLIRETGPISLAHYMAESNARYYTSRDPLGEEGDFITAPEVSQMFGELIGLWFADLWVRMGSRKYIHYVELGPGRGTLTQDALRTASRYEFDPQIHFVETSPALRKIQREAFPNVIHHDDLSTLPDDAPLLIVGNEFFDALPVHQLVRSADGWHERMVALDGEDFIFVPGTEPMDTIVPPSWKSASQGTMIETSAAASALMGEIATRLKDQGGAALIIDYGSFELRSGSTLQAIRSHEKVDVFAHPGQADLTAHVDFELLRHVAERHGADIMGTQMQGEWLRQMGIDVRMEALQRKNPAEADKVKRQYDRLVSDSQMGTLFKVFGICGRRWPFGVGFD